MMRVCSDLLYDFFTLQRDYNKKEGTPSWQERDYEEKSVNKNLL